MLDWRHLHEQADPKACYPSQPPNTAVPGAKSLKVRYIISVPCSLVVDRLHIIIP